MTHVLIIDPIFRGSRLFYTQMAAELGDTATILTRTGAHTPESAEALVSTSPEIREIVSTPLDAWYYHLEARQIAQLDDALGQALEECSFDLLFMSGLDELGPALPDLLSRHASRLGKTAVIGVHYTPPTPHGGVLGPLLDLLRRLRGRNGFHLLSRKLSRLRASIPGLRIALLDERIFARLRANPLFMHLPDPPPPAPEPDAELLQAAHADGGNPTFLLVGRQSRRKGLEDIALILRDHPAAMAGGAKFVLSGSLEKEAEVWRPLLEASSAILTHVDRYVSDTEIGARYRASDFVLLPYTPAFTGSSGVLISAARAGKPVITTDHGLIGERVRNSGIGWTYPSGDIEALARLLANVPRPGSAEYESVKSNCLSFAEENSVEAFQSLLRRAMDRR